MKRPAAILSPGAIAVWKTAWSAVWLPLEMTISSADRPGSGGPAHGLAPAGGLIMERRAARLEQRCEAGRHPILQQSVGRLRRHVHAAGRFACDQRFGVGQGCAADEAAAPPFADQQPARRRLGIGPGDRGEIDAELRRERALGRQSVARLQDTGGEVGADRVGKCEVDGQWRPGQSRRPAHVLALFCLYLPSICCPYKMQYVWMRPNAAGDRHAGIRRRPFHR